MLHEIKNNQLNELENAKVAVLDFSATWCGPCKMFAPTFHEVAREMTDISFASVDVDGNTDLAQRFGVSSVPTIILLHEGKEASRTIGVQTKERFKSWIESNK